MNHNLKSIRIKRGIREDLPTRLPSGEPAFCVDTKELYIGMGEDSDPVPVSGTDLGEVEIEIDGNLVNVVDLLQNQNTTIINLGKEVSTLNTKVLSLENSLQLLRNEFNSFKDSKGRPNGIAPLDSNSQIPANHLPDIYREETIYQSAVVNTSSMVFQLTGINLNKYKSISISHSAPHSCQSSFYINGKHIVDIRTTSQVSFYIEGNRVTGSGISNPVTIDLSPNSTFRWQYSSGCGAPSYNNMLIVGVIK